MEHNRLATETNIAYQRRMANIPAGRARHTSTPYLARFSGSHQHMIIERDGLLVAVLSERPTYEEEQANAAFIVQAVNSHDELVAQLKRVRIDLGGLLTTEGENAPYYEWSETAGREMIREIDATLNNATKEGK